LREFLLLKSLRIHFGAVYIQSDSGISQSAVGGEQPAGLPFWRAIGSFDLVFKVLNDAKCPMPVACFDSSFRRFMPSHRR
jgi:hypothetical protein